MNTEQILKNNRASLPWQPEIFNLKKISGQHRLAALHKNKKILAVSDDYQEQLKELFAINNPEKVYTPDFPALFTAFLNNLKARGELSLLGNWVYYPWNGHLVHILNDTDFQRVRTARNRNLISEEEQKKFYNATIGIGGLSVGNSIALAIVLQGGARHIKLADFDRLALSNLNRVRGSVAGLGILKVEITARQIYELNPYAKVEIFPEGLTEKNINNFFNGSAKLDLVIDELDNIAVKYLLRQQAKKFKVPLIMGADDGDNAVIDIERYDSKIQPKFFHNRLGDVSYESLKNLDKFGIGRTITQHIGPENITERMQDSLIQMGKTIVSWPQLGGAALLNGSALAYCARKIITGESLESNRSIISLDEKLIPNYFNKAEKNKRIKITKNFKKMFKLP